MVIDEVLPEARGNRFSHGSGDGKKHKSENHILTSYSLTGHKRGEKHTSWCVRTETSGCKANGVAKKACFCPQDPTPGVNDFLFQSHLFFWLSWEEVVKDIKGDVPSLGGIRHLSANTEPFRCPAPECEGEPLPPSTHPTAESPRSDN